MTTIPDIIQADIVTSNVDVYWSALPDALPASHKKVLIITKPLQGNTEESQLEKILQACKLGQQDYHIFQLQEIAAWHQLRDRLTPKVVLLFGILPQQLGISAMFGLYHPNRFDNTVWIPCISITEMEKHPDTKKQLWVDGLKPVFVDQTIGNL